MPYRPRQKSILKIAVRSGLLLVGDRTDGGVSAALETTSVILTATEIYLFRDADPRLWPQRRISLRPPATMEVVTLRSGEEAFVISSAHRFHFVHRDPNEFCAWKSAIKQEITKCAEPLRLGKLRQAAVTRVARILPEDSLRSSLERQIGKLGDPPPDLLLTIDSDRQAVSIAVSGLPYDTVVHTIQDIGSEVDCLYRLQDLTDIFYSRAMGMVYHSSQHERTLGARCTLADFDENPLTAAPFQSLMASAEHVLKWPQSTSMKSFTVLLGTSATLKGEDGYRWTLPAGTNQLEVVLNATELLGFPDCVFPTIVTTGLRQYSGSIDIEVHYSFGRPAHFHIMLRSVERGWMLYYIAHAVTFSEEVQKLTHALRTKDSYFASLPAAIVDLIVQPVIAELRLAEIEACTAEDVVRLMGVRFGYYTPASQSSKAGWCVDFCLVAGSYAKV